jgi:hypothetical protein
MRILFGSRSNKEKIPWLSLKRFIDMFELMKCLFTKAARHPDGANKIVNNQQYEGRIT